VAANRGGSEWRAVVLFRMWRFRRSVARRVRNHARSREAEVRRKPATLSPSARLPLSPLYSCVAGRQFARRVAESARGSSHGAPEGETAGEMKETEVLAMPEASHAPTATQSVRRHGAR